MNGRPRDPMTSDANIDLSGSSAMKMAGKTAATIAKSTGYSIGTTGCAFESSWCRYSLMP